MVEILPYAQLLLRLTRVEIRVNDIPIALKETDGITSIMRPIREFLVDGENTARFVVGPNDIPAAAASPDRPVIQDGSAVRLRIAEVEEGEFLDFNVGRELMDIAVRLTAEDTPPLVRAGTFQARPAHIWAWATAPGIDPERDRVAIDDFASKVSDAFARRDADSLIEAVQPSITDRARAYPAMEEHYLKLDIRNALERQDPETWKPVPFNPERALYRRLAGGRLVELLDRDGLPLVRTEVRNPTDPLATPGYYPFPMMIGYTRNNQLAALL